MVGAFQEPQDGYISCLHGAVDSRAAASIQHFSIGPALQQIARPLHVLVAHGDMQWRPGRQTGQTQHARMTEEREGRPNVYTCGWVVRHTCLHKTPTHNPPRDEVFLPPVRVDGIDVRAVFLSQSEDGFQVAFSGGVAHGRRGRRGAQTRLELHTDRQTDGRTDGRTDGLERP